MSEDKTAILHTYNDMTETKMIQDKLKERGIPSFLKEGNVMGPDPVAGVQLHIFEKDKEVALQIITG